jgi:hypothetical protein
MIDNKTNLENQKNHDFLMDTNKQYKDLFNKMQTAKSKFYRFKSKLKL